MRTKLERIMEISATTPKPEFTSLYHLINIEMLKLGYDYHNGDTYKHGNSNLLRRLDKDSITTQSAASLVIRTTGVCCNQVVCKGMEGNKGILSLKVIQNSDLI